MKTRIHPPALPLLVSAFCFLTAVAPRAIAASVTNIKVAAGAQHSLFLANDGSLWATGLNNDGQLGDGSTVTRNIPVQVQAGTGVIAVAARGNTACL